MSSTNANVGITTLADLGLVNTSDNYGKLQHFQEFKVDLENIFTSSAN